MTDQMDLEELLDGEPLPELRHTPTVKEIREWGIDQGYPLTPKGRVPAEVRQAYNAAHGIESKPRGEETPPRYAKTDTTSKIKGFLGGKKSAPKIKRNKPRVSVEGTVTMGWWLLAKAFEPISAPAAKMMALEAPIAGAMLDDAIKNTIVDKVLQPIARTEESGKAFGALLGPPLLVMIIDRNPGLADNLLPILRRSLIWHIEMSGPIIAEKIAKEQAMEQAYGETLDNMMLRIFGAEVEEDANTAG